MIALACASHVLIDLPLFGGPVITLAGGVVWTTRRERRRERGGNAEPAHEPEVLPAYRVKTQDDASQATRAA